MYKLEKSAIGTGGSVVANRCQITGSSDLKSVLFLGFLPPVNTMLPVGSPLVEQPAYPAELLWCEESKLVQLGLIVDPAILFPPHYAYTSGTTKILRDNFAQLHEEVQALFPIKKDDLIVDIGDNDGTLLTSWKNNGFRTCGIEPTDAYKLALEKGIPSINAFFGAPAVGQVLREHGRAKIVTATNVFAHIENVHDVIENILVLLDEDGLFISESHYLLSLIETLQYDTIYHEHLRYYSLTSLRHLLDLHGLEIIHASPIPTHGGSIRVYAARKGRHQATPQVASILAEEATKISWEQLVKFRQAVSRSKLELMGLIEKVKTPGTRIYGIGAPSRASTLINYVGLDATIIDCVLEIKGSYKIGKYMPGTVIPVMDEERLFVDQPEYALLFSWHIADELVPKLKKKGYAGKFIMPLPQPRIIE